MKCVIPGPKVKVFARALHSLAKIGEDLYLDAQEDGLSLKSVNLARSAFVSYYFRRCFFESYRHENVALESQETDEEGETNKCRLSMKAIISAFRNANQLDKNVETCTIRVSFSDYKMRIQYRCRYKVTKTYLLPFIESDSLNAEYDPEKLTNRFTAPCKVLTEAVLNFLTNQEEVTMNVSSTQFVMKNFVEDEEQKIVRTELTMQPGEFEDFSVSRNSSVTYCLKELRSLISFADYVASPISARFDDGGDPIIFSLSNNMLEGSLVMATLSEDPPQQAYRRKSTGHLNQSQQLSEASCPVTPVNSTRTEPERSKKKRPMEDEYVSQSSEARSTDHIRLRLPDRHKRKKPDETLDFDQVFEEAEAEVEQMVGNNGDHGVNDNDVIITSPSGNNVVKTTPPVSKKARYIFQRCFDATFNPAKVPGTEKILAPDSDED